MKHHNAAQHLTLRTRLRAGKTLCIGFDDRCVAKDKHGEIIRTHGNIPLWDTCRKPVFMAGLQCWDRVHSRDEWAGGECVKC
jgi:hypothetical protein